MTFRLCFAPADVKRRGGYLGIRYMLSGPGPCLVLLRRMCLIEFLNGVRGRFEALADYCRCPCRSIEKFDGLGEALIRTPN